MVRIIITVLYLVPLALFGQSWQPDSASISFKIKNAGINVNGSFSGLKSEIYFHPKKLKKSNIKASVDAATVDTGIRIRNKHLRNPDFFDVERFPHITLESQGFESGEDDRFLGSFTLKIKDREDLIQIPFSFQKQAEYVILQGVFTIDRRDFDVGDKSLLLSDKVEVEIWVRAKPGK